MLCETLGVSRTVIREAVKSLVAKGLLVTGPKLGTRVLPEEHWNWFDPDVVVWQSKIGFTREFLRDLQELRRVVEPAAVRLAAERATAADITNIEEAYAGMKAAIELGGDYVTHDLRFHQGLLRACHNRMVIHMSKALGALLRTAFELSTMRPDGPSHSLPLHRAVLDAVIARAPAKAERAILVLIDGAGEDIDAGAELAPQAAVAGPAGAAAQGPAAGCSSQAAGTHPLTPFSFHHDTTMQLLITGGAGFVGARLARTLLATRHARRPAHHASCWPTRRRHRPTCWPMRA
jgi:DNA-binding FadR family transcriptional regulator